MGFENSLSVDAEAYPARKVIAVRPLAYPYFLGLCLSQSCKCYYLSYLSLTK